MDVEIFLATMLFLKIVTKKSSLKNVLLWMNTGYILTKTIKIIQAKNSKDGT